MGVNSEIYLPRDVRVDDVAEVVGILAGLKSEMRNLSHSSGMYCYVENASAEPSSVAGMSRIVINAKKGETLIDGEKSHFCNYFHECGDDNSIELYPSCTPFWIAIGIRLARFYGGRIVFNDCKGGGANRNFPRKRKTNSPQDGKPWQEFQNEISSIKPITKSDLICCQKHVN